MKMLTINCINPKGNDVIKEKERGCSSYVLGFKN